MKENVIDVLIFLFDNYLSSNEEIFTDEAALADELSEAGFEVKEINQAFDWLEGLTKGKTWGKEGVEKESSTFRIYTTEEEKKLGQDCQGFLLSLEQAGIIDTMNREDIIDKMMAIDAPGIGLAQFRRMVGLIMMSQIHCEERLAWLEEFVYNDIPKVLH